MEYYIYNKMIVKTLIWLIFLRSFHCYPNRASFKLPELDISKPEEVNSLEREEPFRRSIDPQKGNNIEDTIKEVEEIIKSNPALPRLTRGEILDLLENITSLDDQKKQVLGKDRHGKAVMVVMPYTPTNDNDMEDLYTKAPVTQIIGAEPFKSKEEPVNKLKHVRRRPPVQFNDTDNDLSKKPLYVEEKKKYSASISEKFVKATSTRTSVRRKRPEATTEAPVTTYRPTTTQRSTTYYPSTQRSATRRPVRRRTTTTQHPNHRYTVESFVPNQGIRVVESPQLGSKDYTLSDLDLQETIRQEVITSQKIPTLPSFVTPKPDKVTTTTSGIEGINLPDHLKTVMEDLNVKGALNPNPEQTKSSLEEQNRIKDILSSIGVVPERFVPTTTTTTLMPNAENVAESLSPDMRELLMSFGLLPNPNEKPIENNPDKYYPEKAEVKAESYIGFKPLPDDGPSRDDMEALLASFGLGRSARRGKSLKAASPNDKNEGPFNFDMIPEHLKGVVDDLGISQVNREAKKIRTASVEKTIEKQHVFNPDTQYATQEELDKLGKIIGMIRKLEETNGTISEEDLKKFDLEGLKELVTSLNGQNNDTLETLDERDDSPDPTQFDVGVDKNEVKRQESTTTVSSVSEESSTSTTVESETPSLTDLEASFGGQTETAAVTVPPVPEVTTKRTGVYYLVDWNTFLDIDDTKGKRVNLRFQPTIGDPKRFLSVSVP